MIRRAELGQFLRSRRGRVDPADLGVPVTDRRRAPGLRREELAALSGVTVSWVTKLEQGRANAVSAQVLEALGRTLGLDGAERTHLFALAGLRADGSRPEDEEGDGGVTVTPALRRLLDDLDPDPAYVLDRAWNMVAWNRAEAALFPGLAGREPEAPNLLDLVFGDEDLARLMVDRDQELARMVAQLRLYRTDWPDRPELGAVIDRLHATSPAFAALWDRRDVAEFHTARRTFDHPRAGRLAFDHHRLAVLDQPGAQLVIYTPAPGTDASARLAAGLPSSGRP